MTVTLPPSPPTRDPTRPDPHGTGPMRSSRNHRILVLALAALAALLAAVAVMIVRDDDTGTPATAPTTASTTASTAPTTTPTTPTTTPSTTPSTATTLPSTPPDTSTAVWPFASSGTRYGDPVDAARGFAVDFIGFVDPVVGEFQPGDTRSGEVEVRPSATGPVTTVLVRQLSGSDTWWVLGAITGNIQLDQPAAMAVIMSPVRLVGTSTAFEANVAVDIREDGNRNPIGQGFVMGGSMGEMAPFDGTVAFTPATAPYGAIVLSTLSMKDGHVWEASVVRVAFPPA